MKALEFKFMYYYFKVYKAFVRNSLIHGFSYRADFWLVFFAEMTFFSLFILFYGVIYANVPTIQGWTFNQSLFLISFFEFFQIVFYLFFHPNIVHIPEHIHKGGMDFILTKPVDSQFWNSLRSLSAVSLFTMIPPLFLLLGTFVKLNVELKVINLLVFVILFISGLLIAYAIEFIVTASAFWFIRIDGVHELFLQTFRFMQWPADIYSGFIKMFLTFIIPVIFTITVPVKAILGTLELKTALGSLLAAALLLALSRYVWKAGLKKYSSASS